jgi:hypothetical protein
LDREQNREKSPNPLSELHLRQVAFLSFLEANASLKPHSKFTITVGFEKKKKDP